MDGFYSPVALWLLMALQFLGIMSACAARFSEGTPRQRLIQGMFLGVLPLMGCSTMVAFAIGPGCWLACATTLAVMVLTVTCDFRSSRESSTW